MSRVLSAEECGYRLKDYYRSRYGQRDTDRWYETSAVNTKAFARDGELISLQCHILTGEVTEKTTKM